MPGWPARVSVREVGPPTASRTRRRCRFPIAVRLIDALSATGLRRIEASAFVSAKAIPPMAGAAEVMAAIARKPGIVYSTLVPNPKGAELADHGAAADEVQLVVTRARPTTRRT